MSQTSTCDVMEQICAAATQDASAAMSRWTGGSISLELNEVQELPLEDAVMECGLGDELLTMVVLTLSGELGGTMILTFDCENGRRLAGMLLGRATGTSADWSELEKSALCETGNILACAYLGALTRFVGANLVPSPPCFIEDYGCSVLEQALLSQAALCDVATIGRTVFRRQGQTLDWNVFFIPTPVLQEALQLCHSRIRQNSDS